MSEPQQLWLEESVRTARALPLPKAIQFLHGLLLSCEDNEATQHIRKIYQSLSESDKQLQLIEDGQLRLAFETLASGDEPLPESPEFPTATPPSGITYNPPPTPQP